MEHIEEDWGLEGSFDGYCSTHNDNSYQKCLERTQRFKTKLTKSDAIERRKKSLKIRITSIGNKSK